MYTRIRLGVVDQHPLFRAGVIHTLAMSGDCEVVAEGAAQEDALHIAAEYAPNVLLLDPHCAFGAEVVQRLATEFPSVRTMMFTVVADGAEVVAALRAGAAGYMLKGCSGPELVESIRRVHRGEPYVDPSLAAMLFGNTRRNGTVSDPLSILTIREEQVFHCVTQGLSNKEIARQLHLSDKTIKHYVSALFEKLQVRNRVEVALLGQRHSRGKTTGGARAHTTPLKP
jgi:two-component system, NarL family, nitrate/nitrite response regulator NarL